MFENTKAFSGCAVDDVEQAREFYEDKLGIRRCTPRPKDFATPSNSSRVIRSGPGSRPAP